MLASRNGHCDIMLLLLKHGADVNMQAKKGWSSLMLSCVFLDEVMECTKILIASGANINLQTTDGFTALMLAILADNTEQALYLLESGADPSLVTVWGGSALTIAIKLHQFLVLEKIITKHHNNLMGALNQVDDSGYTPLMLASSFGQANVVSLLLNAGVLINASNFSDYSSLYLPPQQIKLSETKDRLSIVYGTALDIAFIHGHVDIVSLLLQHGAKVFNIYYLMRSIILKYAQVTQHESSSSIQTSNSCNWENHRSAMDVLFSQDKDLISRVQCTNPSTLYVGCAFGVVEVVSHLLELGVSVNDIYRTEDTGSSYWTNFITMVCNASLFSRAVSQKCNSDVVDLLNQVDWLRYSRILSMLIKHGLDVDHKDGSGAFALSIASREGHIQLVELLLKFRANVDQQDEEGLSSLTEACSRGQVEVCLLLLRYDAKLDLQDKKGWSALMYAVADGNVDLVLLLLERGTQINLQDVCGTSPLMLSCFIGCVRVTEILLQHGADVNLQNNDGITALMMSSYNGHTKIVELLMRYGADMNVVTHVGMTALRVSTDNGHSDVTKLLIEYGTRNTYQMPVNFRKRPLSMRDSSHYTNMCAISHISSDNSLLEARLSKIEHILQTLLHTTNSLTLSSPKLGKKTDKGTRPSLADSLKLLLPIARDWKTIGALLNMESNLLENISYDCRNAKECLQQMLTQWLKRAFPPPSWEELAEAVEYSDNVAVAYKIRKI